MTWEHGTWVVMAVALVVTAFFGALGVRGKARKDFEDSLYKQVDLLNDRLDDCERRHADCEVAVRQVRQELADLRFENYRLRQRLDASG
jgi:uncharacterized membrane-anchored protein YhcB (DUF1043 family)